MTMKILIYIIIINYLMVVLSLDVKCCLLFYSVKYTEEMDQWSCRNSFYGHIKAFGTFVFVFHGGLIQN